MFCSLGHLYHAHRRGWLVKFQRYTHLKTTITPIVCAKKHGRKGKRTKMMIERKKEGMEPGVNKDY